jgi:hypothetical protein
VTGVGTGRLRVRVTVADAWITVPVEAPASTSVATVKSRALAAARLDGSRSRDYEVKYGGGPVIDESLSLGALGIPDGAALIVLARRRRPVR